MRAFVVATAILFATADAHAVVTTDVADAFDELGRAGVGVDNTWDLNLRLWFDTTFSHGTITREPVTQSGVNKGCNASAIRGCVPVDEIAWKSRTYWVKVEAEVGLWRDLSLTIGTAYAISQEYNYVYADGQTAQTSSVANRFGDKYFELDPGTNTKQKGWGALDFILRYAITNQDRSTLMPSWVVGFGLSTPWISKTYIPNKDQAIVDSAGYNGPGIGDGMYRLLFSTAFSKRMWIRTLQDNTPKNDRISYFEPYLTLNYALPIPGPKASEEFKGSTSFGHAPPHTFELHTGVEWVPYADSRANRKIAFQLGGLMRFYTAGRSYSILTPALGDLTFTQQYFDLGTQLGLLIQVSGFVHVNLGTKLAFTTQHFITGEPQSKDGVENPYFCGNTDGDKCSASSSSNPVTYDSPGTRFKDAGHFTANFYGNVAFTF